MKIKKYIITAVILVILLCTGFALRSVYNNISAEKNETQSNISFQIKELNIPYGSFWSQSGMNHKQFLMHWYDNQTANDSFSKAEYLVLAGRLANDKDKICSSIEYYDNAISEVEKPELIYEILFMLSYECDNNYEERLDEVIEHTSGWKKELYNQIKSNKFNIQIRRIKINENLDVPENVSKIILGRSKIEVKNNSKVGLQMERIYRDWLSNLASKYPYSELSEKEILNYHEGSRLRDLLKSGVDLEFIPNSGTIAVQGSDEKWYAPDENGIFRFEVLPDKIMYPTTKCYKNICLLTDTHGISSLVDQSIKGGADLVIGCGDYTGKMEAAYYLAQKGIDVFFPGDRFIFDVLGHDAPGTLIGTAPIRGNVIGDQPVEIDVAELIIVQDINKPYPAQYYDAPKRYFTELKKYVDLNLEFVKVDNLSETYKVVDKARETKAKVIAVRILDDIDYEAVADWLKENKNNRAVLFHTSLYPTQKIFDEFPQQTTFGDTKPVFI